jgi:hypothetical protein
MLEQLNSVAQCINIAFVHWFAIYILKRIIYGGSLYPPNNSQAWLVRRSAPMDRVALRTIQFGQ